jgi:hypothetical protein
LLTPSAKTICPLENRFAEGVSDFPPIPLGFQRKLPEASKNKEFSYASTRLAERGFHET